jgi:hypothetical protein
MTHEYSLRFEAVGEIPKDRRRITEEILRSGGRPRNSDGTVKSENKAVDRH